MKDAPRLGLLALLLASLSLGCLSSPKPKEMTDEQKIDLYRTTANFLYEDDSLDRAMEQAIKVLEIDGEDPEMRRMVAWIRLRMGSTEDVIVAEQMLRALHQTGDDHPATALGLATAVERLGVAYRSASRDYAAGTREPMDVDDPQERAAELEEKAQDLWAEAHDLLSSTLTDGEGSTRAKNALQRICALQGNLDESLCWAREVLDAGARELTQWRRMLEGGNLTEREERFFRNNETASLELLSDTHLFAATLLHRQGSLEEAVGHLDAVIVILPDLPETYSRRAQIRVKQGDWQRAIEDLDRFMSLASNLAFDHPDIRRAFELRATCEAALDAAARG
jgi:tetratricopeptide (TPR) repeat protein